MRPLNESRCPNSPSSPARISAMMEATVGQIFLVVLVARLVGLQISQQEDGE